GCDAMAVERAVQLLANDFPHSMSFLPDAPDRFWHRLADGIAEVSDGVPLDRWREISAQFAALEWLLLARDFDRARAYVARGGQDPLASTAGRIGEVDVLHVPFYDDPG